ncbi:MAG: hypothetical protein NZL98_06335 [Anaerolineales bacterium]|nr:hypothetical protein [Anaerolineales bacterium]
MFRPILSIVLGLIFLLAACTAIPSSTPTPASLPPTPSPLPTATIQPSPTATVAVADLRRPDENGINMEAKQLTTSITLDGNLSEWPSFPCYTLDQKEYIAYGDVASWGGPSDLSGSFCWGWDPEAIYLAAEVFDDSLRVFSKGNFWENDYIELWIDADLIGDFDKSQNDGDDFQFGFLPGNFADIPARATVFVPGVSTGKLRQIEVASAHIEGGYRMEIKIPFIVFGDVLNLSTGRLGAALAFSDCDSDKPAQEMMISSAPKSISQWGNPTLWTNLSLIGYGTTPAPIPLPTPTATPTATTGSTPSATATPSKAPRITITVNHNTPADQQIVYLDVDNNPLTGSRSIYPGLGVDFLIQDDSLYYWTNLVNPYIWAPNAWNWMSIVRVKNTATQSVWKFSSLAIRRPDLSSSRPIKVAFSRQDASWAGLYFSHIITMSEYTLVHTEPPPAPTPTPAPLYSFSFQNNFNSGDHLFVYVDADDNAATGFSIGGRGADYLIQDSWMFKWTGSWSGHACALSATLNANALWQFPSTCLGNPSFGFKIIFQRQDSSWAAVYTSPAVTVSGYSVSHTEPPPPAVYTFTFNNNYNPGDRLRLYLNTDNNSGTGDWIGGADYMVEWYPSGPSVALYAWAGFWNFIFCPSLNASGTNTTVWSFQETCIGSPAFPFTANFVRLDSGWNIQYNGGPIGISSYSVTHSE